MYTYIAFQASTNCGFNFNCSGGAPVVASILAVALIAGADFTAFYVFLPQFIVVGVFIVWIVYFACAHGVARLQQETEGSSTGMAFMAWLDISDLFG